MPGLAETTQTDILLARIDERLSHVQRDLAAINESRHCATHGDRIERLEKDMAGANRKWWAAAFAIVGAWLKVMFFSTH